MKAALPTSCRTHGYAPIGKRDVGRHDWHVPMSLVRYWQPVYSVTINADVFLVWLAQDWLSKLPLNSIIVMANASFHKPADSQQRIEQARHPVALLPPYSPDLNPIEHKWAQFKALQRQKACPIEELFALTF